MSDWRPRLIASDMDGTLLHWDETVSEATVAELERWRADGVPFVLATGRPPRWMHGIREVIGCGTAVCCNGAVLLDLERFEVLDEDLLAPDGPAGDHRPSCAVGSPTPGSPSSTAWSSGTSRSTGRAGTSTRPGVADATLDEMVRRRWPSCWPGTSTCPASEFVALVEEVVGDRATVTNSSADALAEISAAGVTKASGLAKIAARHGVGPEDVVVFGDMPNDIAAFEWVRDGGGRAVAMAHAHPDLLAVATDVTGTNDDDGVAAFLAGL